MTLKDNVRLFANTSAVAIAATALTFTVVTPADAQDVPLPVITHSIELASATQVDGRSVAEAAREVEKKEADKAVKEIVENESSFELSEGQASLSHAGHDLGDDAYETGLISTPDYAMLYAELPEDAFIQVRRAAPIDENIAEETDSVELHGDESYALSPWYLIDAHSDQNPDRGTKEYQDSKLTSEIAWVEPGNAIQVRVYGAKLEDITLKLMDTERSNAPVTEQLMAKLSYVINPEWPYAYKPEIAEADNAKTKQMPGTPNIITRNQWGANEALVRSKPGYSDKVERAIVHHTSGSNSYGPKQSASIVRGILSFHSQGRKWNDIGYNFIVDKYGQIFEGRAGGIGRGVVGAHAQGFNTNSVGISVLGTYNNAAPPAAAQNAVTQIIAWKSKLHGFDPTATTDVVSLGSNKYPADQVVSLYGVIGHKDVGYTDCPGSAFHPKLKSIAAQAKQRAASLSGIQPINPNPPFAQSIGVPKPNATPTPSPSPTPSSPAPNPGSNDVPTNDTGSFERVFSSGSNSSSSIAVSKYVFKDNSASVAVIAREDRFADAMAGGPLAGKNGPVLLTNPNRLNPDVRRELDRVLAKNATIYILGGKKAISVDIENALTNYGSVKRLSGAGRIDTSIAIANEVLTKTGSKKVLIAREGPDNKSPWADALAGGAWGAREGVPVLLSDKDLLSSNAASFFDNNDIEEAIILGGHSAISESVEWGVPSNVSIRRMSGKDRVETATVVASDLWGNDADIVVLANGYKDNAWVWALTAAPLSAKIGAPLLLSDKDTYSPTIIAWSKKNPVSKGIALGDTSMLENSLLFKLSAQISR